MGGPFHWNAALSSTGLKPTGYPMDSIHPNVRAGSGPVPVISDTLFEYPGKEVVHATPEILQQIMDEWGGAIPVPPRFAAREFCTPGERLGLDQTLLYPDDFRARLDGSRIGCDEMWKLCVTPICTNVLIDATGESPFREGQAHAATPDGQLVSFQELIELAPEQIVGRFVSQLTLHDPDILKATWPIVSKIFDNLNPIPFHAHFRKWEIHHPHKWLNPTWDNSRHDTTPTGVFQHIGPEDLMKYLMEIGKADPSMNIREISPGMPISTELVTMMNEGIFHAPVGLATHEVHKLLDEHLLAEARTLDGLLNIMQCFGAVMDRDFPKELLQGTDDPAAAAKIRELWQHFAYQRFDWEANQNPNFARDCVKKPIPAPEHSGPGVEAKWVGHGLMKGEQKATIMTVEIQPGASRTFNFNTPFLAQTEAGEGMIGRLPIKKPDSIGKDQISVDGKFQNAFITEDLSKDCHVKNTGTEPLVLTFDFPPKAHRVVPGVETEGGLKEHAWTLYDATGCPLAL